MIFISNERASSGISLDMLLQRIVQADRQKSINKVFGGASALSLPPPEVDWTPSWFDAQREILSSSSTATDLRSDAGRHLESLRNPLFFFGVRQSTERDSHTLPHLKLSPKKFQILYVTSFLSGKPFSKYIQAKIASGPIPKNKIYKDTKFEKFPKMWILCGREISRNGFWSRDTLPPSTVWAVERFGNLKRLYHHHTAFHLSPC